MTAAPVRFHRELEPWLFRTMPGPWLHTLGRTPNDPRCLERAPWGPWPATVHEHWAHEPCLIPAAWVGARA